ncbi:MAG: HAD domain-containing protein [Rhodocyclaceae bacterium]|nr:HAD domain-containing protein [Rhodocyclaceae bacterium]
MILFLDFDGVLHPVFPRRDRTDEENQFFSCLPRLEAILREFPQCEIVIISSWREHRPWEVVIGAFAPDIAQRIIGATPVIKAAERHYTKHPRFDEIRMFLAERDQASTCWLALDDDHALYPPDCSNLLLCADGFWQVEEQALRERLGRCSDLGNADVPKSEYGQSLSTQSEQTA